MSSSSSGQTSALATRSEYEVPDSYRNITEVSAVGPVQDQNELFGLDGRSIEERAATTRPRPCPRTEGQVAEKPTVSKWLTELYTVSYLIFFAILGTLARLGLQALTFYPGAPVLFSSVWPNLAGSLFIGFLAEDGNLFRFGWGISTVAAERQGRSKKNEESASASASDTPAQKKAHLAVKKTIPLYVGLATGFCGSFTSFSSFMRDLLLAVANDLPAPDGTAVPSRNGGYSFLALLAVALGTISLSFSGFYVGAQLASGLASVTPSLPYGLTRKIVDPLAVLLGWGSWLGAVLLSILPPDRHSQPGASELWRGRATFALVFAPLGCLLRFYISTRLNGRAASFPLGTFAVNVAGTAILGMAWDLAHSSQGGGVVGCQVLQGIEDGFCGCLTTVSTWIMELAVLGHRKAYIYGGGSVLSGFVVMIAIMGGLRWSEGFAPPSCVH
ncbi:CrcB-like protein-domain-containing protein [Xylariaceae sp. FL0594]|nr:CrcB-like protein-domain-containing protein [Xylariaceae sp. FL0594]